MIHDARIPPYTLPNGTRIRVRPIRQSDGEALRRAFHALSPESRYMRFFSEMRELSDDALSYLTNVDGETHIAFVALLESPDLKDENIVGVARAIRSKDDPSVAEAAITIADDLQRMGLGRYMLNVLSDAARARGIRAFRAEVLRSNEAMRHAIERGGLSPLSEDDALAVYEVPIRSDRDADDSPARIFLRAAAGSLTQVLRALRIR